MPKPKNMISYAQVRKLMDRALVLKTILVQCPTRPDVTKLQHDFHSVRALDRKQTTRIYEPEDAHFNVSPYDALSTRIITRDGTFYLEITDEPISARGFKVLDANGKEIEL